MSCADPVVSGLPGWVAANPRFAVALVDMKFPWAHTVKGTTRRSVL